MADEPDGIDEPSLPFGDSKSVYLSKPDEDPESGSESSDSSDQPRDDAAGDNGEANKEPTPADQVIEVLMDDVEVEVGSGTRDAASASEAARVADEDVLDIETEPAVELAAVTPLSGDHDDTDRETSEVRRPMSDVSNGAASAADEDEDTLELEALAHAPSGLDDFSHDDYVAATTVEYQGLAEAMEAANQAETQLSAVAVTMPGLESGVVGFEDVTGEQEAYEETASERPRSDLGLRVITALILLGLLVAALWAGGSWMVAFVAAIGLLALGEFYGTVRTVGYQPMALIGFLVLIAMMISGFRYGPFGIVGWFTVGVVAVLVWYAVVVRRDPLANASLTVLGFAWIGVLLSFTATLAATAVFRQLILAIVLVVAALDVGSYFAGRSFGRTKMSPNLSPNKTYEGLLGGVALAVSMAVGLSYIEWFAPLDLQGALFLAGVAVVLGPFGDLAVSMIKRQIGVKDMGTILPGHGGILDRIDALLFIVPVAYFVFSWLGYFAS